MFFTSGLEAVSRCGPSMVPWTMVPPHTAETRPQWPDPEQVWTSRRPSENYFMRCGRWFIVSFDVSLMPRTPCVVVCQGSANYDPQAKSGPRSHCHCVRAYVASWQISLETPCHMRLAAATPMGGVSTFGAVIGPKQVTPPLRNQPETAKKTSHCNFRFQCLMRKHSRGPRRKASGNGPLGTRRPLVTLPNGIQKPNTSEIDLECHLS